MSRNQRLGVVTLTIVVAVAAFLILKPAGDDDEPQRSTTTEPQAQTQPAETVTEEVTEAEPAPPPEPSVNRISISGGAVEGGAKKIAAKTGETVRIAVSSDTPDEIHVHGYDLTKKVAPGKPARFVFKATIEGEFEIEAHDLGHVKVGSVVVSPS